MLLSRITNRLSKTGLTQCRNALLLSARQKQHQQLVPILSSQFHSLIDSQNKVVASEVSLLRHSLLNGSAFQRFGISSSASQEPNEKEGSQSGNEQVSAAENDAASASINGDAEINDQEEGSAKVTGKEDGSDSDSDLDVEDLSRDDLVKLVTEKEELLKVKHEEFQTMQDKYIRAYAEIENIMARTKREAENSKKYAVQNFAKSLLDVADNLGRAASVVKESFSKIDQSKDTAGAVPLLKTLLEGVEMTDKQLGEVFKKAGIEKYDPVNEQFDPNQHNAIFQVPDPSKSPGTVVVVLKAGYMLHDRVLRPAEVGVTVAVENE